MPHFQAVLDGGGGSQAVLPSPPACGWLRAPQRHAAPAPSAPHAHERHGLPATRGASHIPSACALLASCAAPAGTVCVRTPTPLLPPAMACPRVGGITTLPTLAGGRGPAGEQVRWRAASSPPPNCPIGHGAMQGRDGAGGSAAHDPHPPPYPSAPMHEVHRSAPLRRWATPPGLPQQPAARSTRTGRCWSRVAPTGRRHISSPAVVAGAPPSSAPLCRRACV